MVFLGLEFAGDIPFDDVYVHSVIQAPDGRRMSKSLGTGIDPLMLIDGGPRPPVFTEGGEFPAYGADAVRYGLLAMSSTQDVRFNEGTIAEGRQLANKLFNASRLVLLRVPEGVTVPAQAPAPATVEDTWILSRLQAAEAEFADAIGAFEFHRASRVLYRFIYGELCDWYLEMLKPRLYDDDNAATAEFALFVLAETLELAHPVIPFVTEEIWSLMPGAGDLLMGHRWPEPDEALRDLEVEAEVARAIEATEALRTWRNRVRAAPGARVPARLDAPGYERVLEHVARLARFEFSANGDEPVATVGVPGGVVAVMPSDAVDMEAERKRAAERAERLEGRHRAHREEARQPGLRLQGARAGRPGRARQARQAAEGARRAFMKSWDLARAEEHLLSLELFGMRFGLERMRRLLTVLGSPQERFRAVHVVGHQRQVVDRALHRGAARGARRAHRVLPLAAPDVLRGADPDRRRGRLGARLRRRDPAHGRRRGQGQPDLATSPSPSSSC